MFKNILAAPFVIVAVVLLFLVCTRTTFLSSVMGMATNQHAVALQWPPFLKVANAQAAPTTSTVTVTPTITATYIDKQLCAHHSPACRTGQALYDLGAKYGVDPAFPLAFFWHESQYATTGMARVTHSIGNSRCISGVACVNQQGGTCLAGQSCYASFSNWQAGYESWYQIITSKTYAGGGRTTVEQIIPVYAPAADNNDEAAYINAVETSVAQYRLESSK